MRITAHVILTTDQFDVSFGSRRDEFIAGVGWSPSFEERKMTRQSRESEASQIAIYLGQNEPR
jgi:hypothetical protein